MTLDDTALAPTCPLWRRLFALIYDLLAVVAIVAVVGLVCQIATRGQLFDSKGHALTWWFQPLQYLTISAYFLVSWLRGGQTLGMRPWRIRLQTRDGHPVRWRQALIRLIAGWLPVFALELHGLIGVPHAVWLALAIWALWFAVALPDRIAGTATRRTSP